MRKTFKYRLLGNKATLANADKWLTLCRHLYNCGLEERIKAYKQNKESLSCFTQINELPELKAEFPEYQEVGSQVLQGVLERLDRSYKAFFRRVKNGEKAGFPRFKGKDRYDSFTLKHSGWKLDGKYLTVRKVGRFKIRLSRQIEGTIKTIAIRREIDKWYACFSCDKVPEKVFPKSDKTIGIDVGISSFLTDSEGNKVDNPKWFRQSESKLRRKQRKLDRRVKGSNRRYKARILVAEQHNKVRNQRNDFLHKLSTGYVKDYSSINVEDLNIKGMVKNHHIAKSIQDAGWATFISMLEYKAAEAGVQVVKIPRFEPSSKMCSACGAINQELKLSDRQWVCKECGVLHDRDYNAAKNIKRVGQTLQELTYASTQSVS